MTNRWREVLMTLSTAASVTFLLIGLLASPQAARADDPPVASDDVILTEQAQKTHTTQVAVWCGGTCGANQVACIGTCTGRWCTSSCGIYNDIITGLNWCGCV